MPSKSKAQHKLMAAVANNPKFAKKAGIPQTVGADYMKADKGKKYNMGGVMAHDKKELRNLSDEDYRISNTAAERRRIDSERSYLRNQESSYNVGGKVRGCGVAQRGLTKGTIR
jgi:hypothetical protein